MIKVLNLKGTMTNKFFYILLLLMLFSNNFYGQHNFARDSCCVNWSSVSQLSFSDFTGVQDTTFKTSNNKLANAATFTKIEICISEIDNNKIEFYVLNKMIKGKSWMINKSNHSLRHEQLHFDISEIFARKIRKALNQFTLESKGNYEILNSIVNNYLNEKSVFQILYDKETNHGMIESKQKVWEDKIHSTLKDLDEYRIKSVNYCDCPL